MFLFLSFSRAAAARGAAASVRTRIFRRQTGIKTAPMYVFSSQRATRFTEAGIHHWFRSLKARANKEEWSLIQDVTFHDLPHDFAHRARAAGWTIEEVAYYLGHMTKGYIRDSNHRPLHPG